MKITVIPIHPYQDKHHARLKQLADAHGAEVDYYDLPMGDPAILDKIKGSDIVILTPRLPFDILPSLDNCKLVSLESTGYDVIDLAKAKDRGIAVTNVPDYSSSDVAERVFAMLLHNTHHLNEGHQTVIDGTWDSPTSQVSVALHGKTMGIFGMGKIGQKIAAIANVFGMNVIATTANPDPARAEQNNLKWVEFDELLAQSDFLALAAPATADNKGRFNAEAFKKMKKSSVFINTARGTLVHEAELAQALQQEEIGFACVDVFQQEPINRDNPLLNAPNILLSPHTAYASDESLDLLHNIALDNTEAFLNGAPTNVVNP
jgi:glycerate dehydrogenase